MPSAPMRPPTMTTASPGRAAFSSPGVPAMAATLLLLPVLSNPRADLATLRNIRVWPVMVPGAIAGTYVSLVFWLAGMKYTQASTASALNQTATLWTFVLAALLLLGSGGPALAQTDNDLARRVEICAGNHLAFSGLFTDPGQHVIVQAQQLLVRGQPACQRVGLWFDRQHADVG